MKKILHLIKDKRPLQVRLLVLFLILIYLPILFNVFFIQRQTLNAVKDDKLMNMEASLENTGTSIDQAAEDIAQLLEDRSNQPGIQKGVEDYSLLPEQARENFHGYMERQLSDIENASPYLAHSSVFSLEGDHFAGEDIWHENFTESPLYQDMMAEALAEGWHFLPPEEAFTSSYHEETSSEDFPHTFLYVQSLENLEGTSPVGYVVSVIHQESFQELYQNVFLGEGGSLALWSRDNQPLSRDGVESFPSEIQGRVFENQDFQTFDAEGEPTVFYQLSLDSFPGQLTARIPEASLTQSIEGPLRLNLYLMIFISTLISIWILVEIIIISNMATEKEKAHYRLTLSEELNEKLRMYKHDFSNHLQIIQGLIHLGHSDRALKYLNKISGQGKMIYDTYEIGIPELEVVMYDAYMQGKEQGIEVNIQTMELPSTLPINIYDLVKGLTNLIKNAFEAMEAYPEKDRSLSIEIFEENKAYVFKVSNNLPLIPSEDRERIFEKGFTTKKKGDGFGLYMVRSLIEKHQGTVDLIVNDGGNHFYLRIPKEK
ncbi:ATP-binding protein [Isachenkonia alkalipeptolytica]|uniref:histidine kinase n=1 Tax=Isachenkonia alkalipeptolytica TaxID=2565777 RepID=A0AA44BF01_9CLOT|nr:ATP-binding protein [Isachenkonia alkalipeptolytica]NBG88076.1 GHKL domain-containing protein [Isachenkonia alkalipeptolytica]